MNIVEEIFKNNFLAHAKFPHNLRKNNNKYI